MDWEGYASVVRQASAESIVLLENRGGFLPLIEGEKIAIFGRIQFDYYKSGTGSGGMVNAPYEISLIDAIQRDGRFHIDKQVENTYRYWLKDHPFERQFIEKDHWIIEPWSQEEMPLNERLVTAAARRDDAALIVIGRTAGEEKDLKADKGSYFLSDTETDMIRKVTNTFTHSIVLLNVGSVIDMSWIDAYKPDAVLYIWQGGVEGTNALVKVLAGDISPSGKLSDTIARSIENYPSYANFGGKVKNIYQEDIYVGYRYFETFASKDVMYPFGYGLSYTFFDIKVRSFIIKEEQIEILVDVHNMGSCAGKEVIQVYIEKPQGRLGNPKRILMDFAKTRLLEPSESQLVSFSIQISDLASYDDGGITGYKSSYVLEPGEYKFYVGSNVRDVVAAGAYNVSDTLLISQLEEVLSPVESFQRMRPGSYQEDGDYAIDYEDTPLKTVNIRERIQNNRPIDIPFKGDKGWKLNDVKNGLVSMEEFLSQINNEDLACLIRGEGMHSAKVTPGTASAFGGVTEKLKQFGIPIACCSDGPSGIRRDDGGVAFAIPIGTALSCTFNEPLIEELFTWIGKELRDNKIDVLLGPGMNIHRCPLNGRNFEYFSEDPLLSGRIAAAEIRGIGESKTTGTLKHFAANNQETSRVDCNVVVSERALREIYLKGFEIAIARSEPKAIMSTYGPINGIWTAGNYDLLTTVLRKEWGYNGIVMTDWWSRANEEGDQPDTTNMGVMIRAQNDIYMVVEDSLTNSNDDNTLNALKEGVIHRCELTRNAKNICNVLMGLPTMEEIL